MIHAALHSPLFWGAASIGGCVLLVYGLMWVAVFLDRGLD